MALHEHEIAAVFGGRRVPEMVETDVIQRGRRRERSDMPAHVRVLAGTQHHGNGVPARVRADLVFDVLIAGNLRLGGYRNGVDVRGVSGKRQMFAVHAREFDLLFDQVVGTIRAYCRNHAIEGF